MRILVVNWLDRKNPRAGGAESHLHEIFGRLASRGHEVELVCSGWSGLPAEDRLDGIAVHRVGGRYSFTLRAAGYVRRSLPGGFDVLVEDLNKVPLFTPRWRVAPVVPLVHHLFGSTAFQVGAPVLAAATWILERPIPRVYRGLPTIAVSESTRDDLVRRGLARGDITVIPNGVDAERLGAEPAPERFPEPSLLYLGRLERYKRVDLILSAVAELGRRGLHARLRVAGKGPDRARLERLIDGLGIGDRVELLGFVSEEEKISLLGRSWIHALTSPKEGWGITVLEAAACSTPTVASDSPGLRDSVVDGETGLLVPHGDVGALADALARLLADPSLRQRLGDGARAFAVRHSWESAAMDVERFLQDRVAPTSSDS